MLMDQQNNLPGNNLNANQYDFIMNPDKPKKNLFSGKQKTLLLVAGALLISVLIIVLAMSLFGGGGDDIKASYADLQKQQAEIIRLSDLGSSKMRDYNTSKFVIITKLTIESDQKTYAAYFKNKKISLSKKETTPTVEEKAASAKRDSLLKSAESTGNYDETLTELVKAQLENYQKTLANIYKQSQSTKTKELAKNSNNNVNLLLGKSN